MNENAMMKKEGRGMAKVGMQKMAKGGGIYTEKMGQPPKDVDMGSLPTPKKRPENKAGSKVAAKKAMGGKVAGYAKGGSIDGCATKGKTKGTMVKMAKGGKTC